MYGITFDPESRSSQYRQLVEQLRSRIADGRIPGGAKLASSRELADTLRIARGIVLEAVDQLKLEGYLETRQGSGTYVVAGLAWKTGQKDPAARTSVQRPVPGQGSVTEQSSAPARGFSEGTDQKVSFAPGVPDLSLFPRRAWLSCYRDAVEYAEDKEFGYGSPSGSWRLREAIAAHVREVKGIEAGPERIIVASGASQCFSILASLFDPCRVLMEDPHAPFVRRVFDGLGARISYAPVDEEGIAASLIQDSRADFIYVTPNHQFPTGGTLSAPRRVQLLEKARKIGAWIIEDDFDSEFRYGGKPVAPLHVMDASQVVYVGTFSKTLSPALRLGFMVLPNGLLARVKTAKRRWDYWNESLQQKAMALFIERGHLARHLARCHRAYRAKSQYLQRALEKAANGRWRIAGGETGMHVIIRPNQAPEDARVRTERLAYCLAELGLIVETVGEYCHESEAFDDALIIAYAHRTESELDRLAAAIGSFDQENG